MIEECEGLKVLGGDIKRQGRAGQGRAGQGRGLSVYGSQQHSAR
jgi:hypothetical protein